MLSTNAPSKFPLPFAGTGGKNPIPENSQISTNPGGASLQDGFPPATRTPLVSGGIPPSGLDMNGILYLISAVSQWANAGGNYVFDNAFATDTNVGGYPKGSVLLRAALDGLWLNTTENNSVNPDTTGTGWVPGWAYGFTPIMGLTNANVTLTPTQYGKDTLVLSGTLTGNIQIIFPTLTKNWRIVNNCTGAFTVTAKTAAGTGPLVANGGDQNVYGDGTNIVALAGNASAPLNVGPSTSANQAINQSQAFGVGQTFQTLTGSRAFGTVYTNSTGKPIVVYYLGTTTAANAYCQILVNGSQVSLQAQSATASGTGFTFVVPVGATYLIVPNSVTLSAWYEYR